MSRPDAVYWRNTNHLDSLEFTPSRLVYNRIPRWILGLLVLQVILGGALACAARMTPVMAWTRELTGAIQHAAPPAPAPATPPGKRAPAPAARTSPEPASPISAEDLANLLIFAGSQLVAMSLVTLVALPIVRRAIRRHAGGLKDVFEAIRAMAAGVAPKPLTAGRPGESGFLAMAFNDMMARIAAQRKELVEANENLEKKVEMRTQELREAAEKLEKMAQIDVLTGLANRRALMDQGEQRFGAAVRAGQDLVCLMIDLDNFKSVNDTLGHAMGDEVIRVAADTLRASCRPDDLPARLGGDEFTVLMATAGITQATAIAQRLQDEFRRRIETTLNGKTVKSMPSMSIGITSLRSAAAGSLADLMNHADTALYQAKHGGKARAQVYSRDAA
jgi:diguanylate cyclase (GGDEF)-like protein